ncbi:MAG: fused MFS/spermidine synthase [Acidimicrobiales bacterium]|jgi:spermidine synthase|nr:fused MFS/spermidine synthase [Acidimicrobiales bacterium]
MSRGSRLAVSLVFVVTGFSALTLQVVWQRVISLHAGVDLVSFTTVVAAFLAGIGFGGLLGGWAADRLGPRRSVLAFAGTNLAIGLFAWGSLWLFYDVYRQLAPSLSSPAAKFGFNAVLLAVPTTLMGVSLPLVAKGVVDHVRDAGRLVGRLYALNTFGAALGAALAGWVVIGAVGFVAATRLAGALNLTAAAVVLVVARRWGPGRSEASAVASLDDPAPDHPSDAVDPSSAEPVTPGAAPVWPWYLVYALTGAVALGFELVFFRLIDAIMRSNSYSFAHVLSLYLVFFAAGSAVASRLVSRTRRPERWFLWLQFAVGVSAVGALIVLTKGLYRTGWADDLEFYFEGEGFSIGFRTLDGARNPDLLAVFFGAPLLVMAVPVLCMGASFPFVQALVARRMETLGRHTGRLLFANVAGNVAGTLVVGFVVIDRLGTAGTYVVLLAALGIPGIAAAWTTGGRGPARRVAAVGAVALVLVTLVRFAPTNQFLWSRLHGVELAEIDLAEDRACANALRRLPDGQREMTVNGASQNNYPFDEFHTLIGLAPALLHDDPQATMALGLGIGATPYGLSLDPRVGRVDTVEICSGQVPLLAGLADEGAPELQRFFGDPRVQVRVGDGRDWLLRHEGPLDVVVVDTLRQEAAFSGNLYSVEFYELVRDTLDPDGLVAQWAPSTRTLNSVTEVFPYVVRLWVPSYFTSAFFVASSRPIVWDPAVVAERLAAVDVASALPAREAALVEEFFATARPECIVDGVPAGTVAEDALNRDLFPRDEYFINQTASVPGRVRCG